MLDLLTFSGGETVGFREALMAILLSFGLAQGVALVYMRTFSGLSYSRAAVQGMALSAILTSMLMLAAGSSLVAGIGVVGVISIVRFRTTMRDPRDLIFVFASVAAGVACGARAYTTAMVGTGIFVLAALLLHGMEYGSQKQLDGLLRFTAPVGKGIEEAISKTLREHCKSFVLVTLREAAQGTAMEHAYQVNIPDPDMRAPLVTALQSVQGIQDVTLLLQEPTLDL